MKDPYCELCEAAKISPWFYEDERIWVPECIICGVPLVVLREHGLGTAADNAYMVAKAQELFGADCYIDPVMRLIPDHKHFHVRWHKKKA